MRMGVRTRAPMPKDLNLKLTDTYAFRWQSDVKIATLCLCETFERCCSLARRFSALR
jgi:hypothetical protein